MNNKAKHDEIINGARGRLLECYTERHHIIPRCMGGTDDPRNLVDLTPEEHYVVHQLLVKMYPKNEKLIHAAYMMSWDRYGHRVNNRSYGWVRRKHAMAMSILLTGKNKGKSYEEIHGIEKAADIRKRKSISMLGKSSNKKGKSYEEYYGLERSTLIREQKSKSMKGVPKSAEHNRKNSAAQKGRLQPVIICPHCLTTGGRSVMKRWHFDNCKHIQEVTT